MAPARPWRRLATETLRRVLVGPGQRWEFQAPPDGWAPPPITRTSLYLHVPFCRHACPYCPYTKIRFDESLVDSFTAAAVAEVDWWAASAGGGEITSLYVGGGTPTLALGSVAAVIDRIRSRFRLTGDIAVETNPADVDADTVARLRDMGVALVSLGVQSFDAANLRAIGRPYTPGQAEQALGRLASAGFASVNADLMFALPGQTADSLVADLDRVGELGASQVTAYPLFTFPYTPVGRYLRLNDVRLPNLRARRTQYQAICRWSENHGFERVSVWGFKRGAAPRYSSVTRAGYIGIGPGAGSHLPGGFAFNSFDYATWRRAALDGRPAVALWMPFSPELAAWWWLYWRLYDTRIPLDQLGDTMGSDAAWVRWGLRLGERAGLALQRDGTMSLTDAGAFWLHLAQNYFALDYVNTLWTAARRQPWPAAVSL
jgi:oxygen-independent coproporphyrinogen III oxidase